MKSTLLLPAVLTGLLVAGCSSTPTRVDEGPVNARTFNFISPAATSSPEFADNREEVHRVIQDAITQNLAGRGVNKVASGGDVVVAYLVIIGNNASTASINTYFGYDRGEPALHDKAQKAYSSNKNPNYFEAGTLLIDIVDPKTFKLLKRNYVVRPIRRDATAEVRTARIQEAVNAALGDLRIAP